MGVCFLVFFFFHINRGLFAGREQSLPVEKIRIYSFKKEVRGEEADATRLSA